MTTAKRPATAEEVVERWKAAALAGDTDAVAALYDEDAVLYIPKSGVRAFGRAAISEALAGLFRKYEMQALTIPSDPLIVSRDYAFVHRTFIVTVRDRKSGKVTTFDGPATEVMRRGTDGGWGYIIDHG